MKTLVVAKYKEDTRWTFDPELADWRVIVYDKWAGELPNAPGREAHTYLYHIVSGYENLDGEYVFCQGNPFDHCVGFLSQIHDPALRYFGWTEECDPEGLPRIENMRLNEYALRFGLGIPPVWWFVAGAQFRVTADQIRSRPKSVYDELYIESCSDPLSGYRMERLWPQLLGIER